MTASQNVVREFQDYANSPVPLSAFNAQNAAERATGAGGLLGLLGSIGQGLFKGARSVAPEAAERIGAAAVLEGENAVIGLFGRAEDDQRMIEAQAAAETSGDRYRDYLTYAGLAAGAGLIAYLVLK